MQAPCSEQNKMAQLNCTLSQSCRARLQEIKAQGISHYACKNESCLRREARPQDNPTYERPSFVRDSEKILHTPAYNRLAGKTQVFSFRMNDDITRRGLHTQLVCRIAKDISSALGLNTDLVEACALGHDVGHTPFGHAGERFLNERYHERTGRWFCHNLQSVRVLDVLYGRNISLQTLDGIMCHNGEYVQREFLVRPAETFDTFDDLLDTCWEQGPQKLKTLRPLTREACIVRLADIIAYVGKDRQDAIKMGLVDETSFADGLGSRYNAWALSAFSCDIIENSCQASHITMSEEAFEELRRAKKENYEKIYMTKEVSGETASVIEDLFYRMYDVLLDDLMQGREQSTIFSHHIKQLNYYLAPYGKSYAWEQTPDLCVVDYISSMTDAYFLAFAEYLFGDIRLPDYGYFSHRSC